MTTFSDKAVSFLAGWVVLTIVLVLAFTVASPSNGFKNEIENMSPEARTMILNQPKGQPFTQEELSRLNDLLRRDKVHRDWLNEKNITHAWYLFVLIPLIAWIVLRWYQRAAVGYLWVNAALIGAPSLLTLLYFVVS